ncbi:MAG TPA: hypothetical protein VI072_01880 [Polyangiaceae bacterium]
MRLAPLWIASAALSACGAVGTLRPEDSPAPRDFYAQIRPAEEPRCKRELRVFDASESIPAHEVVSTLSVTCSPGALSVCERRLQARACELEADAVILDESSRSAGVPPGASSQSLVSRVGRAIRWK